MPKRVSFDKQPHSWEGLELKGEKKEQWMHLCEEAANEQDPERLMELVREINRLLEEKERRLKNAASEKP